MNDHNRFIGKRVVDFLIVLTEFFSPGFTAEATSEYRFKIGDFAPTEGAVNLEFQVEAVASHQPFFFVSEN